MLPRPRLWVSLVPYGIGRTKPNHYLEILRTIWDNRHDLPYAWRILSKGVCDGCALGVAGFHDWTMEGVHLCTTRLDLLKLNTARALDPAVLADVANAQPVFMKYLYLARKRGTKVLVVNPLREPGLESYWVPSSVESAMFGTKVADAFFSIHTGGDLAFVRGVLKVLFEEGGVDEAFIREHTAEFDELRTALAARPLDDLARMRAAASSSASSQLTRLKPASPRRRSIGYGRRPRARRAPADRGRSPTSASRAGSSARAVFSLRRSRRVVQRCTPSIVQSRKPATPSAHPSQTPFERMRHAYGRSWRLSQMVRRISP